eukprot:TRINITY_DN46273_c0_g1_i1.p1 TRINITY_DN46273_c0_g1~~TRINITY_DN46273_c0_g1_i1.p1  ORF type:complete len:573 (+),score=134.88 TRINITY_DN46273_c0_g1_i1:61-1719(+)
MQRAWLREFNALGLQLRPQAAKLAASFLESSEEPDRYAEVMVEQTKEYFKAKQGTVAPIIDVEVIQNVIICMEKASREAAEDTTVDMQEVMRQNIETMDLGDGVEVYSALTDVKPFELHAASRRWIQCLETPTLFPSCGAKAKMFIDRYMLLWQRLLLEGELVPEALAKDNALLPNQRILTPVESLVGNPGRKLTFGLLSREHDSAGFRRWTIEDLHRSYPAEILMEASSQLITDGSFVLAEGELIDGVFRIAQVMVPGAVPRNVTKDKDEVPVQVFGGALSEDQIKTLTHHESTLDDPLIVTLSEVHLDNSRTIEKLQDLFQGYEETDPPVAYVFMGSFSSTAFSATKDGIRAYRDGFERLKFRMRSLTRHLERRTRFIFVPGPNDPGAAALPRAPLADYLTSDLAKEIPGVIMATNPCRFRYFSKELVFFRHDVLRLLRRHEAVPLRGPDGATASPVHVREEMVRLLLDQAHLVPLPLEESNILWSFDHTLRLYPLPHAVHIGGVSQPFEIVYQDCCVCSVGPFHRDATFHAYRPHSGDVEECAVPDQAG